MTQDLNTFSQVLGVLSTEQQRIANPSTIWHHSMFTDQIRIWMVEFSFCTVGQQLQSEALVFRRKCFFKWNCQLQLLNHKLTDFQCFRHKTTWSKRFWNFFFTIRTYCYFAVIFGWQTHIRLHANFNEKNFFLLFCFYSKHVVVSYCIGCFKSTWGEVSS